MDDLMDLRLQVPVPQHARSYEVRVRNGALDDLAKIIRTLPSGAHKVALVSDEHVWPLHGGRVRDALVAAGFQVVEHVLPPGESCKTTDALLACIDVLIAGGMTRADCVVALGGGVVGDIAGLAAHLLLRGLPIVQCPTSLLAQVDASVGGKVAVDHLAGKNLVGAFHFPAAVLVDPLVLATLPRCELQQGGAEMLKHALLAGEAELQQLLACVPAILAGDGSMCAEAIATSVAFKAAIVGADPFEQRDDCRGRKILNLGHTLGHGIEAASRFALGHGAAVGLGLRAAARFSDRRGLSRVPLEARVASALEVFGLPTDLDTWLVGPLGEAVGAATGRDKKHAGSRLSYIALREVGQAEVVSTSVDEILDVVRP